MKKMDKVEHEDDSDDQHDPYESKGAGDVAAQGFRKIDFGPDDEVNYNIKSAYVKQANPKESENTKIQKIAKHMTQSQFYSDKKKAD